jgi:hypothetical protein
VKNKASPIKYILLFIPWGISVLLDGTPLGSYIIAWLGSFYIFFISYSGILRPLPSDRPIAEQIMRPIFLIQITFAGYMSCTSLFYLLDVYGYENFQKIYDFVDTDRLRLAAQCQRYYCLGHASFTAGLLMFMDYPVKRKVKVEKGSIANLLFGAAIISFPLSIIFLKVPGLSQFSNQFSSLSFVACVVALAYAIPQKKIENVGVCVFLYLSNFYTALTSGFKEPIILSVLVLGVFLYPAYKKTVLLFFTPAILFLFLILPTYASVFRQNAWTEGESSDVAKTEALDAALNKESVADETTWEFLVGRLSEIDMFAKYVKSTPDKVGYYRFDLVKQAIVAVIPRFFWPSKPSTEAVVMQRVYDAGVINPYSVVSAKPAFIVDAYLSGGTFGVFICLFIYGAFVQLISLKAEQLFGGYELGTALIFSGLFQIFWRGLSFEFILNNVVWSYITMLIIAKILRSKGILLPV